MARVIVESLEGRLIELSRVHVLANERAGSVEIARDVLAEIGKDQTISLRLTKTIEELDRAVDEAIDDACDLIVAAGGDGTVNHVLNRLMATGTQTPLSVLPIGTGNDANRMLGMPASVTDVAAVLFSGDARLRQIDVLRAMTEGNHRYGLNTATAGNSTEINAATEEADKKALGAFAYLKQAAMKIGALTAYNAHVRLDEATAHEHTLYNIVVGNGQTSAGGLLTVPHANPEDGYLDLVLIHEGSLPELLTTAARFILGDLSQGPLVTYSRAQRVRFEQSDPKLSFFLDGEPIGFCEEIAIVPKGVTAVIGPGYLNATTQGSPLGTD